MIVLDTCALLFDALEPHRLSPTAAQIIAKHDACGELTCADISLWEIAMLVDKQRLQLPATVDCRDFIADMLLVRGIEVLPINADIATLSTALALPHFDPADRLIAATAVYHHARLVTCDEKLLNHPPLMTVW